MEAPRVFDCFIFFNEFELLEIRLNELNSFVDYFVLVESTKTFSGKDKPLYYLQNKKFFEHFNHKIIHIVVDDMPHTDSRWEREFHQRNAITRGLKRCSENDLILISDVDEIPRISRLKGLTLDKPKVFIQKFYYYYFNCLNDSEWPGTIITKFSDLSSPQELRDRRNILPRIENGGWHFSYLGNVSKIKEKIEAFSHAEYDTQYFKDTRRIQNAINSGKDLFERGNSFRIVPIDNTYPKYLRENLDKFKHLVKNTIMKSNNSQAARDPSSDQVHKKVHSAIVETVPRNTENVLEVRCTRDTNHSYYVDIPSKSVKVIYYEKDLGELDPGDQKFDCIVFRSFLADPLDFVLLFKKLKKSLSQNGSAIFAISNLRYFRFLEALVNNQLDPKNYSEIRQRLTNSSTRREIEELLDNEGFELCGIQPILDPAYDSLVDPLANNVTLGRLQINHLTPQELHDLFTSHYIIHIKPIRNRVNKTIPLSDLDHLDEENLEKTHNELEELLRFHPTDFRLRILNAQVLYKMGLFSEALDNLEWILTFENNNKEAKALRDMILAR